MRVHVVESGDCLSSIAKRYGFFWKTLWGLPENQSLRDLRIDPNTLLEGDEVAIPELDRTPVSVPSGSRHSFVRKGIPTKIRFQLLRGWRPRAGEAYVLKIGTVLRQGTLDSNGRLEEAVACNAGSGTVLVGDNRDEYPFDLGEMDPLNTVQGVQKRLNNLGFDCGDADGIFGPRTAAGIHRYQQHFWQDGLEATGKMDDATTAHLRKTYGR